jgi:molecular chaperone GrpE (heat shock protein)
MGSSYTTNRSLRETVKRKHKEVTSLKKQLKTTRRNLFKKNVTDDTPRIAVSAENEEAIRHVTEQFAVSGDMYCQVLHVGQTVNTLRCTEPRIEEYLLGKQCEPEFYVLRNKDILFYQALQDYIAGTGLDVICDKYKMHPGLFKLEISILLKNIISIQQLRFLISTQLDKYETTREIQIDTLLRKELFVEEFVNTKISSELSSQLTPEEMVYAYLYVTTSDNGLALEQSGLIECLYEPKVVHKNLLGIYLRDKTNIKSYIKHIRETRYEASPVTRADIQTELVEQVDKLKELLSYNQDSKAHRVNLLKSIELLGKTIGAFVDKVEVKDVSAADAIDQLIEMSKVDLVDGPIISQLKQVEYTSNI